MKGYFKGLFSEPITTVEGAEQTIKRASYGFYVIGLLGIAEGLINTIMEAFFHIDFPPNENLYLLLTILFIIGVSFFMNLIRSRLLAGLLTAYFIFNFLANVFPKLFLGTELVSEYGLGLSWVMGLLVDSIGLLISFGAVRGTTRFHQLK